MNIRVFMISFNISRFSIFYIENVTKIKYTISCLLTDVSKQAYFWIYVFVTSPWY